MARLTLKRPLNKRRPCRFFLSPPPSTVSSKTIGSSIPKEVPAGVPPPPILPEPVRIGWKPSARRRVLPSEPAGWPILGWKGVAATPRRRLSTTMPSMERPLLADPLFFLLPCVMNLNQYNILNDYLYGYNESLWTLVSHQNSLFGQSGRKYSKMTG